MSLLFFCLVVVVVVHVVIVVVVVAAVAAANYRQLYSVDVFFSFVIVRPIIRCLSFFSFLFFWGGGGERGAVVINFAIRKIY